MCRTSWAWRRTSASSSTSWSRNSGSNGGKSERATGRISWAPRNGSTSWPIFCALTRRRSRISWGRRGCRDCGKSPCSSRAPLPFAVRKSSKPWHCRPSSVDRYPTRSNPTHRIDRDRTVSSVRTPDGRPPLAMGMFRPHNGPPEPSDHGADAALAEYPPRPPRFGDAMPGNGDAECAAGR